MSRKRWWRSPPIRVPALPSEAFFTRRRVPENCPGGQATMAQFLPVPAKESAVSVEGPDSYRDVQSRFYEAGKRTISFVSRYKLSWCRAKIVTSFLLIPACYVLSGILKTRTLAIISLVYYPTR
jgi:hypothetical protein